ncbi:GTPase-associated protein 1-related protein [Streptomyces sp. NBC_01465]|uniref:GTPase-associated protein 1-related protein n=1 Tax=Streptomyces sp. NBC_01465 TaxID=2903878 RepID=UPI002E33455B|nr:GTPase-associated protein 1-related protein [Streptomyces sp. NBC_01465]
MSLAQLHYTSAPPGPDGSGFRFTAVSPGLPQSLLREAEQLIGYEPPRDAPPRPTDAELADFPQALSHSVLSDGGRLLARTVYTGADYSGRWGNFHAHAVHLPDGAQLPGGVLPITAWDSSQWAVRTPEGGVPAPLEKLAPSGLFGVDGLASFAASRAAWLAGFFGDLRRLCEDPAAPQIVLVEQRSADVAQWVALGSAVLPLESARRLTFTTYTRRPQQARQQIIGVLPDDAQSMSGHDHRYRLHHCAGRAGPVEGTADAWAQTAARVWLGRAPELFRAAEALSEGPFEAGPLAALALGAGIALPAGSRAAGVGWVPGRIDVLDEEQLERLVATVCAPGEERHAEESAALGRLFAALEGRVPAAVTAPLAALLLTEAVRTAGAGLSPVRRSALTEGLRQRLAAELGPEIREGVAHGTDAVRPLELLRIADTLDVDCTDLLPDLARKLSRALLADPDGVYTPSVRLCLEEQFELRAALLEKLDTFAAGDPPAAARMLERTALPFTGMQALPHLRMCAEASRVGNGDRVSTLHSVLRASGMSPFAEPLVLRTAVALVWDGVVPRAGEARLMLDETGSDAHRTAGTWTVLVRAALEGSVDDPDVPALARDLLRRFTGELDAQVRGALMLLDFAGQLREGTAPEGWTARVLSLRSAADPVEPVVLERTFRALARRLLGDDVPDGELFALTHSGDADLIAAYGRAARDERVLNRLRISPGYVADCFTAWSGHSGASTDWDNTRNVLLEDVLRPIVRALPDGDIAAVEQRLERAGGRWAEGFRTWNRPGAFGRFAQRFGGGRGRRGYGSGAADSTRWGDVEPPRKGGRES